jgi:hypothetical protein
MKLDKMDIGIVENYNAVSGNLYLSLPIQITRPNSKKSVVTKNPIISQLIKIFTCFDTT